MVFSLGGKAYYIEEGSGGKELTEADPGMDGPYRDTGLTVSGWIIAADSVSCPVDGCYVPLASCTDQVKTSPSGPFV